MVASIARLQANRRNALKSTGPLTDEGKARSRANALKHGLTAVVCRTERDEQAAEDWARLCPDAATSTALDAEWLAREVAVITDQIERIGMIDGRNRERAALRAMTCWDDDRRREAEALGSTLARRPSEVVGLLEATPQGCRWMIERWAILARIADLEGGWDEAARTLAEDLLGTPPGLRKGTPGHRIDTQGRPLDDGPDPAALARSESERLSDLSEEIAHLDDFDRDSALGGLDDASGLADRRLRNYESALFRRLRWYLEKLGQGQGPPSAPAAGPAPEPTPTEPEEAADPAPESGPTSEAGSPEFPTGRRDRKVQKVERRKAAAGRKLTRRLA